MDFDINTFKEAKNIQTKINEKTRAEEERHRKKQREISNVFYEKERKIREEKYKAEREAEAENEKNINLLKMQRVEADKKGAELRRILSFMDILKKTESFNKDDFKVYVYDYPRDEKGEIKRVLKNNCSCYPEKEEVYLKPIDTLHEDEHLKLNVYIGDNDKPKNKKSLFVVGKTSLMSNHYEISVLNIPRDYGIKTHTKNDHIRKLIKDFPNEKTALSYYEKNKNKILKEFIEEHKKAVAELEEVKKNTNTKEWEIFYLEDKKQQYKRDYSRFEENEDYLKVCEELEKLKGDL